MKKMHSSCLKNGLSGEIPVGNFVARDYAATTNRLNYNGQ